MHVIDIVMYDPSLDLFQGVAATHIASQEEFKGQVKLLVADRNFSDLEMTANSLVFRGAGWIMRHLTGWSESNVRTIRAGCGAGRTISAGCGAGRTTHKQSSAQTIRP